MCSIVDEFECSGDTLKKADFSVDDWISIKARTGVKVKRVCTCHYNIYVKFYALKQKTCCDPLLEKRHSAPVTSNLKRITVPMFLKSRGVLELTSRLIPGKQLCKTCWSAVNKLLKLVEGYDDPPSSASSLTASAESSQVSGTSQTENSQKNPSTTSSYHPSPTTVRESEKVLGDPPESPTIVSLRKVNEALQFVGVSPVLKRKLPQKSYAPQKLQKISEAFDTLMTESGAPSTSKEDVETKIIAALKEKFKRCTTKQDKIYAISVALTAYSQRKVYELFQDVGASEYLVRKTASLMEEQDGLFPTAAPRVGQRLPEEIAELVRQYYESDESSRLLPGKKDYVSTRVNGKRVQTQKRLVLCNLKELYALFKQDHPQVVISFSKFASLRPKHCVLAGASGTHSICVCKHHQNFKLMIEGAKFKELNINLETYHDFINNVTCENATPDCYLSSCCPKCPGIDSLKEKLLDLFSENFVESITYQQWTSTDRSSLETKVQNYDEFVETMMAQLHELLPHNYIAKEQSKYLSSLKENLQEGEVVVISDFSENYSFVVQDSVQGYYWSNDQATIHPFVCYHKENGTLKTLSYTVISDYMKHNISAVYTFQRKLVEFLKRKVENFKKIIYFSDGAASQYKNCFNVINLSHHVEDFNVEFEWHFFGTSHGKGPSDGLGGQFKRNARRASLQGVLIRSAKELYEWALRLTDSTVTYEFISIEDVENVKAFLKPRFYKVITLNGIRNFHSITSPSIGEAYCKRTSASEQSFFAPIEIVRKVVSWNEMEEGLYITVDCGSEWKLGQIILTDSNEQELIVEFLKKDAQNKYSHTEDSGEAISFNQVICVVKPDVPERLSRVELSATDLARTAWQYKVMHGKKFPQPDQIQKGTWQ